MRKTIGLVVKKSLVVLVIANIFMVMNPLFGIAKAAPCTTEQSILGIPTWYKYLDGENGEGVAGKCRPIINTTKDTLPIGLAVLEAALTLGGIVAVAMVFVGGFKYVLSQGEPDKAANGRRTVMNAVIGLAIIMLATRVVSFIGNRLG